MMCFWSLRSAGGSGAPPDPARGGATVAPPEGRPMDPTDYAELAEAWTRRAKAEALRLGELVHEAETPRDDFAAQALGIVSSILSGFDAMSPGDSEERRAVRIDLARTVARLLTPAHAEHLTTIRIQVGRSLRLALAEVSDEAFVDSAADIAARADVAFRSAIAASTPEFFLEAWRPSLDAAYQALRDDFREAFEDRDLQRALPKPPSDDEDEEEDQDQEEEDGVNPFLFKHPRIHHVVNFLRPRVLQIAGLVLNIIQAKAAIRSARRAAEQRDVDIPKLPLF